MGRKWWAFGILLGSLIVTSGIVALLLMANANFQVLEFTPLDPNVTRKLEGQEMIEYTHASDTKRIQFDKKFSTIPNVSVSSKHVQVVDVDTHGFSLQYHSNVPATLHKNGTFKTLPAGHSKFWLSKNELGLVTKCSQGRLWSTFTALDSLSWTAIEEHNMERVHDFSLCTFGDTQYMFVTGMGLSVYHRPHHVWQGMLGRISDLVFDHVVSLVTNIGEIIVAAYHLTKHQYMVFMSEDEGQSWSKGYVLPFRIQPGTLQMGLTHRDNEIHFMARVEEDVILSVIGERSFNLKTSVRKTGLAFSLSLNAGDAVLRENENELQLGDQQWLLPTKFHNVIYLRDHWVLLQNEQGWNIFATSWSVPKFLLASIKAYVNNDEYAFFLTDQNELYRVYLAEQVSWTAKVDQ